MAKKSFVDPDLLVRRGKIGSGTEKWDMVLLGCFGFAYLGILAIAALDKRHGWSEMSEWLWPCNVIRTACEDRTLHRELEGYEEYAKRVRFRLVPGIW